MTIMKTTRRKFLSTTGTATAALGFPSIIPSSALGNADRPAPSNRIVMGGIGIGNMGRGDHGAFLGKNDVQYVAICDVRKGAMNQGKAKTDAKYGNKDCKAHDDYREILSRDDIDAVHISWSKLPDVMAGSFQAEASACFRIIREPFFVAGTAATEKSAQLT